MPRKGWRKGDATCQITLNCFYCGREFKRWPSYFKHHGSKDKASCSKECRWKHLNRWIDDKRYKASHGYIMVLKEGIDKSCKLSDMVYEHRVIAEKVLGRKLDKSEEVHHLNGNPSDNRLENLFVVDAINHKKLKRTPSFFTCEKCGHSNHLISLGGVLLSEV